LANCSPPAAEADARLENLCVWAKDNAGMGSLYRSQHELIFVFKTGIASATSATGLTVGCRASRLPSTVLRENELTPG
jgi:D-serine dehydratase